MPIRLTLLMKIGAKAGQPSTFIFTSPAAEHSWNQPEWHYSYLSVIEEPFGLTHHRYFDQSDAQHIGQENE